MFKMFSRTFQCTRTGALAALLGFWLALAAAGALAQEKSTIVIAAPFSGTHAPLGVLIQAAASALERDHETILIDTGCDVEMANQAALEILSVSPDMVLGVPCIDSFDALAPVLIEAGVPMTVIGLQTPDVTRDKDGLVQRVAPTLQQIHAKLAAYLGQVWRDVPFAIVDDGTLSGRLLAEQVGGTLAEKSLEPIFRDTYRPLLSTQAALVRRLNRAGVQHVILGGDAFDAATIGADAARLGVSLSIAGGPNLLGTLDDGQLPDGTIIASALPFSDLVALAINTLTLNTRKIGFDADGETLVDLSIIQAVQDGTLTTIVPSPALSE
ncbi:MAG: ABC transporter substrate-binding protein, partial [Pseudomonadota bacterium]